MVKRSHLFGFILMAVLSLSFHSAHGAAAGGPAVGSTLPEFKLTGPVAGPDQEYLGLTGSEPFTLEQVSGKLFIIDFFNSM